MFSEFLNVVQQGKKSFLEEEVRSLRKQVQEKNTIIDEMRKSCGKRRVASIKCLKSNNQFLNENKMRYSSRNS